MDHAQHPPHPLNELEPAHHHHPRKAVSEPPRWSLIQLSVGQRLVLAGLMVALLWGGVVWAMLP